MKEASRRRDRAAAGCSQRSSRWEIHPWTRTRSRGGIPRAGARRHRGRRVAVSSSGPARMCSASGSASASSRSQRPCGGIRAAWRGPPPASTARHGLRHHVAERPLRGGPRRRLHNGIHRPDIVAAFSEHPLEHVAQRGRPRVITVEGVAIGAARGEAGHQRIARSGASPSEWSGGRHRATRASIT
jgi:hypothetical protein